MPVGLWPGACLCVRVAFSISVNCECMGASNRFPAHAPGAIHVCLSGGTCGMLCGPHRIAGDVDESCQRCLCHDFGLSMWLFLFVSDCLHRSASVSPIIFVYLIVYVIAKISVCVCVFLFVSDCRDRSASVSPVIFVYLTVYVAASGYLIGWLPLSVSVSVALSRRLWFCLCLIQSSCCWFCCPCLALLLLLCLLGFGFLCPCLFFSADAIVSGCLMLG